jgi:hypothetical protein
VTANGSSFLSGAHNSYACDGQYPPYCLYDDSTFCDKPREDHSEAKSKCLQDKGTDLLVTMVTIHCSRSRSADDGMLATSGDWAFCWPHWQSAHRSTSMHSGMLFCHSNCMCLRKFSARLHCKHTKRKGTHNSLQHSHILRRLYDSDITFLSQLVDGSSV